MKILVTGGTGFLGIHVREFFAADDFSRRSNLDLLNPQDAQIAENYDVVIHLAALLDKSRESAEKVFLTNVEGTVNLLRRIKKNAVFIFASTKDVYGRFADNFTEVPEECETFYNGQSALEWSKLIAEKYVDFYSNKNDFRSCIFRLSTVYAPLSPGNIPNFVTNYADAIRKGKPVTLPCRGRPVRDILHVSDLSLACEAFIDSIIRHGFYNLGGGKKNAVSLKELVEKMEKISNLKAIIKKEAYPTNPVPMNYISDLKLVSQELDWKPEIGVDDGLKALF